MVRIRETDYHHGAFTAALVNSGFQIELFETIETRRSYQVQRGEENYLIYSKFSSAPSSQRNGRQAVTWSFSFSEEEINKIKQYQESGNHCLIALTAHYGGSDGGELAILTINEFLRSIGAKWHRGGARVAVLKEHRKQVKVYGTGIDRVSCFVPKTNLLISN